MKFSNFVVREAILTDLQATTKEEAIREIVRSLHHAGALAEADLESITRMVLAREELGTTGAGQGVAIPETRHPAIKRVIGTIALSRRGVEWDAMDGEPVDVLFLLISPPRQPGNHLLCCEIIGWLVYGGERFVTRIRQAQTREQVIALLDEADQVLAVFPSQDELKQLPLRALVALAARCARRVQPFFTLPDDHPEKQRYVAAVERAIRTAEEFARGIPVAAPDAARAASNYRGFAATAASAAAWAAEVASKASDAEAASDAVQAVGCASGAAWDAARAVWDAARAAGNATDAYHAWFTAAAASRSDLSQLRGLGLGRFSELGEPLDPSADGPLGPLWPEETRGV
jgi:mannitol/fructose-specific phosphotransferase system IIA component (Ntr-type)